MGNAGLKHFSHNRPPYPSPKSAKHISLVNDLCLFLVERLPGAAYVLAEERLSSSFCIAFPDLLYPLTRDLHIESDLFCRHPLLLLADNPMDHALV